MAINHGMHAEFVERWHLETSSFHISIGEMTIKLDDVSCHLHLPIREKLIDRGRLGREETVKFMVTHLGADPIKAANEVADTRGAHARFKFLEELYKDHLQWGEDFIGGDMQVDYHQTYALRCYILFLVGTSIFVDKNATYIDVVYLTT
ncbi:protein MAIN-LIKE 1-like [Lathyrus oleraceus]|uniref:protein MAIN-LIKE 1-like n=1 Tax=Pisum sativum TaxID=3888 RepID=UPI0021CFE6BE|nr:protein MAIN-LIKE 1-like [Pisum sativum]